MKKCTICQVLQDEADFRKFPRIEERADYCLGCGQRDKKASLHSLKGKLKYIFRTQRDRVARGDAYSQEYTQEELIAKYISDPHYIALHRAWIRSDYDKWLAPSVDRKDDYKSYTLDNIQMRTWKQNFNRSHEDRFKGLNNKMSFEVYKVNNENQIEDVYPSQAIAARDNHVTVDRINDSVKFGTTINTYNYFNVVPIPRRMKIGNEYKMTVCLMVPTGFEVFKGRQMIAVICEATEKDFENINKKKRQQNDSIHTRRVL